MNLSTHKTRESWVIHLTRPQSDRKRKLVYYRLIEWLGRTDIVLTTGQIVGQPSGSIELVRSLVCKSSPLLNFIKIRIDVPKNVLQEKLLQWL